MSDVLIHKIPKVHLAFLQGTALCTKTFSTYLILYTTLSGSWKNWLENMFSLKREEPYNYAVRKFSYFKVTAFSLQTIQGSKIFE